VVIVVVAVLLTLIVRTANQINSAVSAIWTVGQQVANNTVHIPSCITRTERWTAFSATRLPSTALPV
jgi:hypothetical protein